MRKDAEGAAADDERRRKEVETINEADALVYSTEKLFPDLEGKVAAGTIESLKSEQSALKKLLEEEKKDVSAITEQMKKLVTVTQTATTELYSNVKPGSSDASAHGGAGKQQGNSGEKSDAKPADDVVDADFEDVSDKKSKDD